MSTRATALDVWVHGRRVGRIEAEATSPRSFSFTYGPHATETEFVSLTMPVRERRFEDGSLFPIFEQNLPEGELKAVLGTRYAKTLTLIDDFDYLAVCGPYWQGRVRLSEVDGEPKRSGEPLALRELLSSENHMLFEELVGRYGFEVATRSGVQPKLALTVQDGDIQPVDRTSIWTGDKIVKFENDDTDYPGIAIVEYVCMTAAREAKIPVPGFEISEDGRRMVIDRFDVAKDGTALGFEEAATLMLFHAAEKYSSSYGRMCRILLEEVSPSFREAARMSLVKQLLLMMLIGNGDAHLKNFGVVYSSANDVHLAPAYDVVCTTLYLSHDQPALGFEGRKIWFTGEALVDQVAKATGMGADGVVACRKDVEAGIGRAVETCLRHFRGDSRATDVVGQLADHWQKRREGVRGLNTPVTRRPT